MTIRIGEKVKVRIQELPSKHMSIRFDSNHPAISTFAPKGASGQVLEISANGKEVLVELYWNAHGLAVPGGGETWRIWVKTDVFGHLLSS